jgi:hypothetical protein
MFEKVEKVKKMPYATREKNVCACVHIRTLFRFKSISVKRNARNVRAYKAFRQYILVGQRYCNNKDIMKESALSFKN